MAFNITQAEFDLWAPDYDREACDMTGYAAHVKVAETVRALCTDRAIGAIVDLGTGTGLVIQTLRASPAFQRAAIHGYDFSALMLKQCATKNIATTLTECDLSADSWPINNASADIVTAAGLLDFIPNPKKFLANTHAIMKEGGVGILTFHAICGESKERKGASPSYPQKAEDMRTAAQQAGFTVRNLSSFDGYEYYGTTIQYGLLVVEKPAP